VVRTDEHGTSLLYIDRHLIHEVTSPQAFEGLRLAGRKPWRPGANLATPDHNVPTVPEDRHGGVEAIHDPVSRLQVATLDRNADEFGIPEFHINDPRQGIVHVVGPEEGATLPGMTVVCGDSHTATHGAFGALAFGIGTSEVEHVLATQCLIQKKSKSMLIEVRGQVGPGVTAKDIVLAIIGEIGTAGGTGHAIEFGGQAIRDLSMEGRMTVCNMAIEAGARAGFVAVDEKTIEYVKGRPYAPKGGLWEKAVESWRGLHSDEGAEFDKVVVIEAAVKGRRVADNIRQALVVPGSGLVKRQAEEEGLDRIFIEAGFEWREPGCSMCLAMNADRLEPGERCASTSNRNFEGRQGAGGRTHLVSPAMAAAAAITGHFVDVRNL